MFLKTIQWAYNLGVRNERHRIARYLEAAQSRRHDYVYELEYDMRNNPVKSDKDAEARQIEQRLRKADIDKEVIDIIASIFRGEEKYERGASVMYPEGEKK